MCFPAHLLFNIWNIEVMNLTNKWYWIEIIPVSPQVILSAAGDVAQQTYIYIFKNIIWVKTLHLLCRYCYEQKTLHMHYFSNLFWCRTLHVSDGFTVHHQKSSTVYTAIGICHTGYVDCLLAKSGWNILISLAQAETTGNMYFS